MNKHEAVFCRSSNFHYACKIPETNTINDHIRTISMTLLGIIYLWYSYVNNYLRLVYTLETPYKIANSDNNHFHGPWSLKFLFWKSWARMATSKTMSYASVSPTGPHCKQSHKGTIHLIFRKRLSLIHTTRSSFSCINTFLEPSSLRLAE